MPVSVLVNGIDRSQYVAPISQAQLGFSRALGARGTATFTMNLRSSALLSAEPAVGQNVSMLDGSTKVFAGSIDDVKKYRLGNSGGFTYEVSCVSLEQRLDKRLVTVEAFEITPGAVVAKVLSFLPDENISIAAIDTTIGPQVSALFDAVRATDIFDQMATLANAVWFCDNAGLFYFVGRSTFSAPWDFTEDEAVRYDADDQIIVERNRTDFRNRQRIRFAQSALPPEIEVIAGDGTSTDWLLDKLISSVVSLFVTTSVQAQVAGTFSGLPNPGDTISITSGTDTIVYTWRSGQVNGLVQREVLIGVDAADCAANFCAAVNKDAAQGALYSWPTLTNPYCMAFASGGGGLNLFARNPGAAGNSITVSSSCAGFSWGSGSLSGGSDGTAVQQGIGIAGVDTQDYAYLPGGRQFFGPSAPVGSYFLIQYYPVAADIVTVEDSASVTARMAVEGGSGIYDNLVDDSQNGDWNSAFQEALGYLAAYGALLEQLSIQTDRAGVFPGQLQKFNLPSLGISNLWYFIQQVDGVFIGGTGGFRYTLTAISSTRIGTWLQFWAQLGKSASGSSSGSPGFIGSGTTVAPAGLITDVFYDAPIVSDHVAIELDNGRKQKVVLNQATQVTIDNPTRSAGAPTPGDRMSLYILIDSTAGRPTPAWGSAFGSDVKNQVLDPAANTRSAYQLSLHDDNLWHLDSFNTGLPVT